MRTKREHELKRDGTDTYRDALAACATPKYFIYHFP